MAEQIDLATPDQAQVGTSEYKIVLISLGHDFVSGYFVNIGLRSSNGYRRSFSYDGDEAQQMIIALNKANLSTKSLQRRIFEKLIADGKLEGSISGVPD